MAHLIDEDALPTKKDYRERYKRIAESEEFRKNHDGMSLGDIVPVEGEEPVDGIDNGDMPIERWKQAVKAASNQRNYRSSKGLTETRDDYFVDGVQWADEHPKEEPVSNDFEMALAEMIDKAQTSVVEPWVIAAQWKDELVKLAKGEEPVSVWHDASEEPEEGKDFAFVTYNGIMWARYRIEDIFLGWQKYRIQTGLDKWAYVSDLLKL